MYSCGEEEVHQIPDQWKSIPAAPTTTVVTNKKNEYGWIKNRLQKASSKLENIFRLNSDKVQREHLNVRQDEILASSTDDWIDMPERDGSCVGEYVNLLDNPERYTGTYTCLLCDLIYFIYL